MRAKTEAHVAEHLQAGEWPLGDHESDILDRLDNLHEVGFTLEFATGVVPTYQELQDKIYELGLALQTIYDGSKPSGRWLDMFDTQIEGFTDEDTPPPDPNAYWEEYSAEEQRAWLDAVVEVCERALGKEEHNAM